MSNFLKNYRNSIGYMLFKKVYITYFIFVIIFIFYQIFSEYSNSKKESVNSLKKIEKVYKNLFTKHIISENSFELQELSNTIFATTNISGILIKEYKDGFSFSNGEIPLEYKKSENQIDKIITTGDFLSYKIELLAFGKKYASITLFMKNSEIFASLKESIVLILINLIASMIILWVLFFIFTGKYLIEPLNEIIDATKRFDVVEHEIFEINTKKMKKNELQKLANTFNKMSKRINEAYINMQQLTMIREIQKNKLEDQKNELIKANKAKDDFLANMSHELKTPLNSINVISDVMAKNRSGKLDEKQVKNLQIINKCGKDLLFLINDVLDLSKLEAGQIIVNNSSINLKDLMSSIYDMFYPQTKMKNIDFVMKIDESLESIYSDEDRIKQIIKNLLSNALKFTEKGRISLVVKDDKENIRIIVEDEGIGIPKDKLEHIFDRFKQVDGSTTRKYGGTGLGLAICKELAMLLKGDVYVSSELDKGSKFEFIFSKNLNLLESLKKLEL